MEEKRNVRSAIIFGGLTLLIIIFFLFFGIPLVARVASFFSGMKGGTTVDTTNLPVPPPPDFSTLPEFTKDQKLHVEGSAQPGSTVLLYFNDQPTEVKADDSGKFKNDFSLVKGNNTLYAKAKNKAGVGEASDKFTIVYDTEAPKLDISSPHDGDSFFGDKQKQLTIEGTTEAEASVTVNDRIAIVGSDGKFRLTIDLSSGENTINISSTDRAGNKKETSLKVNFTP
ncbi:MAG TPA: Ig-like domain-containing protein [Patescibacteria group bacterium]